MKKLTNIKQKNLKKGIIKKHNNEKTPWNKLNNKLRNNLNQFQNNNKKKTENTPNKKINKTDPPNHFPWVWIISENKHQQKRPTTLIRTPHSSLWIHL